MTRLDHAVIAVGDLERASAGLLERYGLTWVDGGRHDGWGTANRLVPLGDQYLELIAADAGSAHPLGQAVRAASAAGDRWMGVCCEVDDVEASASRLGTTVVPGERTLPDGTTIAWRLTGLEAALGHGLPFFIEWVSGRDLRLGRDVPADSALGISRVELGGDPLQVAEWLGGEVSGLEHVGGPPGVRAVAISTADGEVELSL